MAVEWSAQLDYASGAAWPLGAAAENNLSNDVEVYKGYQIEYQAREAAGIVRVTANVTAQPLPAGRRPQRFAAEARDPADARISARGQATFWIDNVAPVYGLPQN